MDSSNAESTVTTKYHDAIVGDANRQLHALEAEVAELREQLAAAEAVIEKVRDYAEYDEPMTRHEGGVVAVFEAQPLLDLLPEAPSVVLEDRDREVAARAVEAVANEIGGGGPLFLGLHRRAAAIRKGDTNA